MVPGQGAGLGSARVRSQPVGPSSPPPLAQDPHSLPGTINESSPGVAFALGFPFLYRSLLSDLEAGLNLYCEQNVSH